MNRPHVPVQVGGGGWPPRTWDPFRDHLNSNEDIVRRQGTWVTSTGLLGHPEKVALAQRISLPAGPEHPSCPGVDG